MNLDSFSRSFFEPRVFGVVEVTGKDAQGFLHRMSTNNVDILKLGESCLTAFINQKARLIAACYLVRSDETHFHLVLPYAPAEKLIQWLDHYLFVEDVSLKDQTLNSALLWVIGETTNEIAGPDFHFGDVKIPSQLHLSARNEMEPLKETLKNKGFYELNDAEFESFRIASEVVFSPHEINESVNPIQLGLSKAIHWAKGCYIGQEVISRLESKDRADKSVVGIRVDQATWKTLKQGESLSVNEAVLGNLSSVAPLYLPGSVNALVVFKKTDLPKTVKTDLSNVLIDIKTETD